MPNTHAHPVHNAIAVHQYEELPGNIHFVSIVNNEVFDYDGYVAAPNAINYDGIILGKCAFDSDKHLIYYRSDKRIATFK